MSRDAYTPKWAELRPSVFRVSVLEAPQWDGAKFAKVKIEEGQDFSSCHVLMPVLFPSEKQVFLVHINTTVPNDYSVTIYASAAYSAPTELTPENAFAHETQSTPLACLQDFVQSMALTQMRLDQNIRGRNLLTTNLLREEDVLVHLCWMAQEIVMEGGTGGQWSEVVDQIDVELQKH